MYCKMIENNSEKTWFESIVVSCFSNTYVWEFLLCLFKVYKSYRVGN
jgi:hypothetical protein